MPRRTPERRDLRGATYNLDNNRDDFRVVTEVAKLFRVAGLDFCAYQEGQEYADNLAAMPQVALHTTRGKGPSERDAGILTRTDVPTRGYTLTRTRQQWPRDKGPGLHWPRSIPGVVVDWLRVYSVHMPRQHHQLAYATVWTALLMLAIRRDGPMILVGDWNKGPMRNGAFTPRLLAKVIGGQVYGDGIDYVIARGCVVDEIHRIDIGGSDHRPVVFTVRSA